MRILKSVSQPACLLATVEVREPDRETFRELVVDNTTDSYHDSCRDRINDFDCVDD
jgi:hypothetical protein